MIPTKEIETKCAEIIAAIAQCPHTDPSLLCGHAGFTIFYAYANKYFNDAGIQEPFEKSLQLGLGAFQGGQTGVSFSLGYAGICWSVAHLTKLDLLDADVNELFGEVIEFLKDDSIQKLKQNNFDFMDGGLGLNVFLVDERNVSFGKPHLENCVSQLLQNATLTTGDAKWIDVNDPDAADPVYNLGLSHGIPAIIWFLSLCYMNDVEKQTADELLNKTIAWLLKQKNDSNSPSVFPMKVKASGKSKPSKLSWCYGDLGIASVLWQAGLRLNNSEWKEEGVKIMLHAAKRKRMEGDTTFDAGLCHGSAGIAHMFNRFYKETKMEEFEVARMYWLKQTLELATFTEGLAGYKAWDATNGWQNEYGLLEGIAGIGLSLLGFLTDDVNELNWDRCLLLS